MRAIHRLLFLVSIMNVAAAAASASEIEVKWIEDVDQAWAITKLQERPLLIFITQDRCKYCTKMKKATYQNDKTVTLINDHFVAVEVNGAQIEPLVKKLGIRAYPTTVVITPDAKVADQVKGYLPPAKFNERLMSAMSRAQGTTKRK